MEGMETSERFSDPGRDGFIHSSASDDRHVAAAGRDPGGDSSTATCSSIYFSCAEKYLYLSLSGPYYRLCYYFCIFSNVGRTNMQLVLLLPWWWPRSGWKQSGSRSRTKN